MKPWSLEDSNLTLSPPKSHLMSSWAASAWRRVSSRLALRSASVSLKAAFTRRSAGAASMSMTCSTSLSYIAKSVLSASSFATNSLSTRSLPAPSSAWRSVSRSAGSDALAKVYSFHRSARPRDPPLRLRMRLARTSRSGQPRSGPSRRASVTMVSFAKASVRARRAWMASKSSSGARSQRSSSRLPIFVLQWFSTPKREPCIDGCSGDGSRFTASAAVESRRITPPRVPDRSV
mmetsp:Transcript_33439/g.105648  ORF Transcript_33439/g.105648 Transcript_33439/m.105648 type:complete len:234 (+) Transcript_33439:1213-1914(+)